MTGIIEVGSIVVGGGPAGLAPLVAASRSGILRQLLDSGLVVAERGPTIGAGRIGRYLINSDSSADTFLACIIGNPEPSLAALVDHPTARAIAPYGRSAVPLVLAGAFLAVLGEALGEVIEKSPNGRVMTGQQAISTQRTADGRWSTRLRSVTSGAETIVVSRAVLLATGAGQPEARLTNEPVAGRPLSPDHADRLMQSDHVLTADGMAEIEDRLADIPHPRIAIVGGSTSAMSCARVLLAALGDRLQDGAITLMHRKALPVFYPSASDAQADGYDAFGPDDICPVSGFVFRFGGLRFESRTLLQRTLRIGGAIPDHRFALHRLDDAEESQEILRQADLVVSAVGYRPRALPVLDADGHPLQLRAFQTDGPMVGAKCGVLAADGHEIAGLFGIGLAAGFRPDRTMGGEPSFTGQVNGLWLWQHDVGALIAGRMLKRVQKGKLPARDSDQIVRRTTQAGSHASQAVLDAHAAD